MRLQVHVSDVYNDGEKQPLESVVDRNELDDFFNNAILSEQTFEAEKQGRLSLQCRSECRDPDRTNSC